MTNPERNRPPSAIAKFNEWFNAVSNDLGIERYKRTVRREWLDQNIFETIFTGAARSVMRGIGQVLERR